MVGARIGKLVNQDKSLVA